MRSKALPNRAFSLICSFVTLIHMFFFTTEPGFRLHTHALFTVYSMLRKSNNNRVWFQSLFRSSISPSDKSCFGTHCCENEDCLGMFVCVRVCGPLESMQYIFPLLPKTNKQRHLSVHCFSLYITTLRAYWSNILQWQSSFIPLGFVQEESDSMGSQCKAVLCFDRPFHARCCRLDSRCRLMSVTYIPR